MKRNEMIKIILNNIKKYENCKITKQDARELLDILEKNGMAPPIVKIKSHFGDAFFHTWENDNEKKSS